MSERMQYTLALILSVLGTAALLFGGMALGQDESTARLGFSMVLGAMMGGVFLITMFAGLVFAPARKR